MRALIPLLALLFSQANLASQTLPDTPAAQRLQELTSLMANASPSSVASYIREHYTPAYAERLPLNRRIGSFMDWHHRGGMEVVDIVDQQPHHIEVITHQPVSRERWRLIVDVEGEAPHRIESIRLARAPFPALDENLSDADIAERWLNYVDGLSDAELFSGAVLIARHGEILGQQAWGLANRDFGAANEVDTRFNLGSLNKTWTAVAIAQLVERGALAFDDPLSKFIDYPDRASAEKIRIEHLLTHSSGLGNYFTEEYRQRARGSMRSIDDFLALSADQTLAFEPGTDWAYSNTGMMVLGRVIEIASGQNYDDYLAEHVLGPAGMRASGCFELDRVNRNLAVGYSQAWSIDGVEVINNLYEHVVKGGPAGGCYSTVGDLFRFATALTDGTLVSKAMAEVLTSARPELQSPHYGYGFELHPEGALFGHSGGFVGISANLDIVEQPDGWVIVVLANEQTMRAPALMARHLIGMTVLE